MNMKEAFGVLSFFDSLAEKYKTPIHKLNLHVDEIGDLQVSEYNGDTFKSLDIICRTELTREQRIANLLEHVGKELEGICGEKSQFTIAVQVAPTFLDKVKGTAVPLGKLITKEMNSILFEDKQYMPF